MPQLILDISLSEIANYCYNKQHILISNSADFILHAANTLVGIHAARLITPYFALRARVPNLEHDEIYSSLYEKKTLIKARCMRGTLHLLPENLFNSAHNATLKKRVSICHSLYKKFNLEKDATHEVANIIQKLLHHAPLTSDVLTKNILSNLHNSQIIRNWTQQEIRAVIKELWELGSLCYINGSKNFGTEERLYGLTENYYPAFNAAITDINDATRNLLESYLRGYGPATLGDMIWWSGLEKGKIQKALFDLQHDIIEFSIKNHKNTFYILKSEFSNFEKFKIHSDDWVAILSHEDPSLKGYHESRSRYIGEEHYNLLFNDIGESRPAIMLNGQVIGIWAHNKTNGDITMSLFTKITGNKLNLIKKNLADISMCAKKTQTNVCKPRLILIISFVTGKFII